MFGFFSAVLSAQPSVQITSPADKTIVRPGQTLNVQVTATGGTFQRVVIIPGQPLPWSEILTTPPYNFSIQIPPDITPGPYPLTASCRHCSGSSNEVSKHQHRSRACHEPYFMGHLALDHFRLAG